MASWTQRGAFSRQRQRAPDLLSLLDMLPLPENEHVKVRPIGPAFQYNMHYPEIHLKEPSKKTGKMETGIPTPCLRQGEDTDTACPYCEAGIPVKTVWLQNVIDRAAQKRGSKDPGKPSADEKKLVTLWDGKTKGYVRDKKSKYWTPVKVLRITSTLADRIVDASELNTRVTKSGEEKCYGTEHPKFGFDMVIKFAGKNAKPANMYTGSKTRNSKLTEEELAYPLWNLSQVTVEKPEAAAKNLAQLTPKLVIRSDDGKTILSALNKDGKRYMKDGSDAADDSEAKAGKTKKRQAQEQEPQEEDNVIDATEKKPKKKKKASSKKEDKSTSAKPKKKKAKAKADKQETAKPKKKKKK